MANIKTITDIHGNTYDIVDAGAQRTLVSGTNIKTINNTSLLGSGNISIGGGGGGGAQVSAYTEQFTAVDQGNNYMFMHCEGFDFPNGAPLAFTFDDMGYMSITYAFGDDVGFYLPADFANLLNIEDGSTYELTYYYIAEDDLPT